MSKPCIFISLKLPKTIILGYFKSYLFKLELNVSFEICQMPELQEMFHVEVNYDSNTLLIFINTNLTISLKEQCIYCIYYYNVL